MAGPPAGLPPPTTGVAFSRGLAASPTERPAVPDDGLLRWQPTTMPHSSTTVKYLMNLLLGKTSIESLR